MYKNMKQICAKCFLIPAFVISGCFYSYNAQGQNAGRGESDWVSSHSARSSSDWEKNESSYSGNDYGEFRSAPDEEEETGQKRGDGEDPIGPGFFVLLTLSGCYLSYLVLNPKKEERK